MRLGGVRKGEERPAISPPRADLRHSAVRREGRESVHTAETAVPLLDSRIRGNDGGLD